jgi:copper transport protein
VTAPRLRRLAIVASVAGALVAVLTAVFVSFSATPAFAHAQLVATDPPSGGRVVESPEVIRLEYTEPVELVKGGFVLIDMQRRTVDVDAKHGGAKSVVEVRPGSLEPGGYVLSWRVVSADSHPIRGAFTFTVGDGELASPDLARVLAPNESSRAVGLALGIARGIHFGVLLAVLGMVALTAWAWPSATSHPAWRRVAVVGALVAAVTALAAIGLHGASITEGSLPDAVSASVWREVADTRFGIAWLIRAAVLVALAALVALRRRVASIPALTVAVVAIGTMVLSGHAVTGRWRPVALMADAVHVAAAAVWIGGLAALAVLLAAHAGDASDRARFAMRFSSAAIVAVVAVSVSGVVHALRQGAIGSALVDTDYGQILVAKVVAVAVTVGLATRARRAVRAIAADGTPAEDTPAAVPRLSAVARGELVVLAVVIGLTAALVEATPPRAATAAGLVEVQEQVGDFMADVLIDPAGAGPSTLHVTLFRLGQFSTVQAPVDEVTATVALPDRGVEALPVKLLRAGPAHFVSDGLVFPFPGRWDLTVTVRVGEFDRDSITVPVRIR